MTAELAIKLFIVGVVFIVAYWMLRWLHGAKFRAESFVMKVWAAFGPYDTANSASDSLRCACYAVFGREGTIEHESWREGHTRNFQDWEVGGSFQKMQETMRKGLLLTAHGHEFDAACQRFRDEAMAD